MSYQLWSREKARLERGPAADGRQGDDRECSAPRAAQRALLSAPAALLLHACTRPHLSPLLLAPPSPAPAARAQRPQRVQQELLPADTGDYEKLAWLGDTAPADGADAANLIPEAGSYGAAPMYDASVEKLGFDPMASNQYDAAATPEAGAYDAPAPEGEYATPPEGEQTFADEQLLPEAGAAPQGEDAMPPLDGADVDAGAEAVPQGDQEVLDQGAQELPADEQEQQQLGAEVEGDNGQVYEAMPVLEAGEQDASGSGALVPEAAPAGANAIAEDDAPAVAKPLPRSGAWAEATSDIVGPRRPPTAPGSSIPLPAGRAGDF